MDASGTSVSAILMQRGHPLAYFSRQLTPRLQAASTYAREMFAIIEESRNGTNTFSVGASQFKATIAVSIQCYIRPSRHRSNSCGFLNSLFMILTFSINWDN